MKFKIIIGLSLLFSCNALAQQAPIPDGLVTIQKGSIEKGINYLPIGFNFNINKLPEASEANDGLIISQLRVEDIVPLNNKSNLKVISVGDDCKNRHISYTEEFEDGNPFCYVGLKFLGSLGEQAEANITLTLQRLKPLPHLPLKYEYKYKVTVKIGQNNKLMCSNKVLANNSFCYYQSSFPINAEIQGISANSIPNPINLLHTEDKLPKLLK